MIYIACDHGGVELKNAIAEKLRADGREFTDLGTNGTESVDYPDFGFAVAERVSKDAGALGIVICKSGVGMSICANKVKGVRCGLCFNAEMGRLCREHNNANVLALGAGNTDIKTAMEITDAFLT
ncbi:MAG: RpiB/LacA/LacB family sugar-phosphate isomerase, partial [Clostridiales bacterium]|nr:RpiB/LacA/LacB family sugar-phosphate isomerase [Clostridiales bacterium]